jgi:hypothetical protein
MSSPHNKSPRDPFAHSHTCDWDESNADTCEIQFIKLLWTSHSGVGVFACHCAVAEVEHEVVMVWVVA